MSASKKTVFICGGHGFVGSKLAELEHRLSDELKPPLNQMANLVQLVLTGYTEDDLKKFSRQKLPYSWNIR